MDSAFSHALIPERIRSLLRAEPFTPFTIHLIDHHTVHIGDPQQASFEDNGETLVIQTMILRDRYVETVTCAAIIRLLVKMQPPARVTVVTEESVRA